MKRRVFLAAAASAGLTRPARADARVFGRGSWQDVLAEHAGHPAVVHFWGLTCGPCVVELPEWGQFAATHPRVSLVVIAADSVPQPTDQLAATLVRAGLSKAESWAFDGAFSARLYFEVDPSWQGELPRTTLIDGRGGQTTWLGATRFTRVNNWLESQSS